jgi:hypothetical protein
LDVESQERLGWEPTQPGSCKVIIVKSTGALHLKNTGTLYMKNAGALYMRFVVLTTAVFGFSYRFGDSSPKGLSIMMQLRNQ